MVLGRSPAWYALHVKPHSEHRVVDDLTLNSIPTFLPLMGLSVQGKCIQPAGDAPNGGAVAGRGGER